MNTMTTMELKNFQRFTINIEVLAIVGRSKNDFRLSVLWRSYALQRAKGSHDNL